MEETTSGLSLIFLSRLAGGSIPGRDERWGPTGEPAKPKQTSVVPLTVVFERFSPVAEIKREGRENRTFR